MLGSRFSPYQWLRAGVVAGVALCGNLWAQAPEYTAAGIVNASDYSPGPFAPSSALSLFGTNLAWATAAVTPETLAAGSLPTQLASTIVFVDSQAVPLLYVSPTQINFLVPSEQIPGDVTVTVVRQGTCGPTVTITLIDAAPALFVMNGGYALAQDWNANYKLMTPDAPAQAGDTAVLYATGLGHTNPPWPSGEVPQSASYIASWASLQLLLNGVAIDPHLVLYAGLTPGYGGLYQINFTIPANAGANPEVRVQIGTGISIPSIKLEVE
ncbi:MAG: IPT/TIG domain-containing protein [Bryobacteraceae bacterium]